MPPSARSSGTKAANRERQSQYQQSKSATELSGYGCGPCPLISPHMHFSSPFVGTGWLEISAGLNGVGSGSFRLCQGDKSEVASINDIFLVPFAHIEQIIVLPTVMVDESQNSDQVIRIIIVPTAATGFSPLTRKYPKIIQFDWDKKTDEEGSGKTLADFRTLAAEHLTPFGKSVVEYSAKGKERPWFKATSTLEGDDFKSEAGALWFLPTGILWLGVSALFLSFDSLTNKILLIFIRDMSDSAATRTNSYSAMKFLCEASEPFYANKEGKTDLKFVGFADIQDLSLKDHIYGYMSEHRLRIMNLEQSFYNYKERTPLSGWMPLMS